MSEAVVTLKKGEGRSLKAGGLWIYDNEIDTIVGTFKNGDIVIVHDFDGYMMGRGFINQNSKIRIRMMTRSKEQLIDRDFLKRRVQAAWNYRKDTVDTSSCRVIFGEADFLPGIVIDKYEDVLVVESLALGIDRFKNTIVELVKECMAEDGITIRGVYERSDAKEREKELGAIPSVISPAKKPRRLCRKWRARNDGNYGDSPLRRWLDVLQWDLQSMPCSGNVYDYNIDGEQIDVDNGGQEGWLN